MISETQNIPNGAIEYSGIEFPYLLDPSPDYWSRTPLAAKFKTEIKAVRKCSGKCVSRDIPRGRSLKRTKLIKEFLDCDAVINQPIIKPHVGVGMSCDLKNLTW